MTLSVFTRFLACCSVFYFVFGALQAQSPQSAKNSLIADAESRHKHEHKAQRGAFLIKENKGQWHDNIRFQTNLPAGRLYFEDRTFTYYFFKPEQLAALHPAPRQTLKGQLDAHIYRVEMVDANTKPIISPALPIAETENYFLGKDETRWATGVRAFQSIQYQEVYPKVNLLVYNSFSSPTEKEGAAEGARLKYDFRIAPGGNPDQIRLRYNGIKGLTLQSGKLVVPTSVNTVVEDAPFAYQVIGGKLNEVPCLYQLLDENTVGYLLPNGYDPAYELVIDPTLIFSTYTGSLDDNWGFTATYDDDGALYSGGIVAGPGYPVTVTGPAAVSYDFTYGGGFGGGGAFDALIYGCDMAIIKYNATGSQRLYSTYLGGQNNEQPHSLIVNANKELFIMGATRSNDYPVTNTAYDKTFNGAYVSSTDGDIDIVVSRLSANGSVLQASTFYGGSGYDGINQVATPLHHFYADDARGEIVLDPLGNPIIVSTTRSNNFPTSLAAIQTQLNGTQDAVVFKLTADLSSMLWSTYLGGSDLESGYSSAFDSQGNIIVACGTNSIDLEGTPGAWREFYQGGTADGYVAVLSPDGSNLIRATLIGTNQYDQCYFVDADEDDNIYVTGQTQGNYPVLNSTFNNTAQGNPNGGQFITKLKPDLSEPVFSSRFGNGFNKVNMTMTAFLVDICENIYVAGWGSPTMPDGNGLYPAQGGQGSGDVFGLPTTPDAFQSFSGGSDFYLFVLAKDADSLLYGSFIGGNQSSDHVDGGTSRFDKKGIVYQSVCASCGGFNDFPTAGVPSPFSATNGNAGINCNNASFKFEFDLIDAAFADYEFTIEDSAGCAPYTVDFTNGSIGAETYLWDFGDSTTSTEFEPTHVYTQAGIYPVKLNALTTGKCNSGDEVLQYIYVYADATPAFSIGSTPCSLSVNFVNQTIDGTTYRWSFGDGAFSTQENPTHTYINSGVYTVRLIVNPGSLCSDTTEMQVEVGLKPIADFQAQSQPCNLTVNFSNQSQNATEYIWSFGDQSIATIPSPSHNYTAAGSYLVRLIANPNSPCPDTLIKTIVIQAPSVADFAVPQPGCVRSLTFFNSSANADEYLWDFGDGSGVSFAQNPNHIFAEPGVYTVRLVTNASKPACADTVEKQVYLPYLPDAAFSVPPPSCDLNVAFTNLSDEAQTFFWDFGDGSVSNAASPTHAYPAPGVYQVTLFANPDSFCTNSITQFVNIIPVSVAQFTTDAQNCSRSVFFENNSLFSDTYFWDFGDGSTSTDANPTHIYTGTGEFTVTLVTNQGTNCASTTTAKVNLPNLASAAFNAQTTECSFTAFFQNQSEGAADFYWDFGNGETSILENPTVNFAQSGTYEVRLIVNADSLCPDETMQLVSIKGFPTALFEVADTNACDSIVTFGNNSKNALQFEWIFGDGQKSSQTAPVHAYELPGVYEVLLIANPNSPCPDTTRRTVEIKPQVDANFETEAEKCSRTVTFINRTRNGVSYAWFADDKLFSTEQNPVHTFAQDKEYKITLVANPDSLCPDSVIKVFFIGDNVTALFAMDTVSCDSLVLPVNLSQNADQFVWQMGDGQSYFSENPPVHRYKKPGVYTVTLTVDKGTLCEKKLQRKIRVVDTPTAAFEIEQEPCGPLLKFKNLSKNGVRYVWEVDGKTVEGFSPGFIPNYEGQLTVQLVTFDQYGCTDTATKKWLYDASGKEYIFVPTVFSPNGDNRNETMEIKGANVNCITKVEIFDRWGGKVFETANPYDFWDGTQDGKAVPETAYVYVVTIQDRFKKVGTVTVVR